MSLAPACRDCTQPRIGHLPLKARRVLITNRAREPVRTIGASHRLRCYVLYASCPADLTTFGQLREPRFWPWMLMLLNSNPLFSVSVCVQSSHHARAGACGY